MFKVSGHASCHGIQRLYYSLRPKAARRQPGSAPVPLMESSMLADEELTATEALDILHTEASPDVGCGVKGYAPTEMDDEQ